MLRSTINTATFLCTYGLLVLHDSKQITPCHRQLARSMCCGMQHTYQLYTFFSGEAKTSDESVLSLDCKHPILLVQKLARLPWRQTNEHTLTLRKGGKVLIGRDCVLWLRVEGLQSLGSRKTRRKRRKAASLHPGMATPDFQSPTVTRAFSRVESTPRPTPNFLTENSFSHRRRTPFRAPRPPRPPTKSCPPVSRIFKRSDKGSLAHTVSFLTSGHPVVESPLYKTDSQQLYFEQCFEIRQKLGEGSFGEVYEVWSAVNGHTRAYKALTRLLVEAAHHTA